MNNTSTASYYISSYTDDNNRTNLKENNLLDFDVVLNNFNKDLNNIILILKDIFKNNIDKTKKKGFEKFDFIINKLIALIKEFIYDINNSYNSKYENLLKACEQKIRILYENKFNLELKERILEESIFNLLKKEKEYELIKEKTGIIIHKGKIVNNNRKENEIFILKKENSILKNTIEKQKLDLKSKEKNIQGKKVQMNKKLILKLNLRNKPKQKVLSRHSHPKSNPHFQPYISSKLSNSISKFKSIISHKTILNKSFTKNFNTENSIIYNSTKKINTVKNIKIKKVSTKNTTIKQNINRSKRSLSKKNKNSLLINKTGTILPIKDNNSTRYTPEFKNRNFSEYFNNKNGNLLIINTLNNCSNQNKRKKYSNFISPRNGKINNIVPKVKYPLVTIKYSHSFTSKNNINNINSQYNKQDSDKLQNKNIKKILLPKNDNNRNNKNILLALKKKKESKLSNDSKKNISNVNIKRKKNNNYYIINNTTNNNFCHKTKNHSIKKI